ncbi:MAG: hypothetical protein ACP5O1_01855 [Phycisphaerae bacterium]
MTHQRGFMLLDLLLGIALLVMIAAAFTRLSFEFTHQSHTLSAIRRRVRSEDIAAFEMIILSHHATASASQWRITPSQADRSGGAILPRGCHWVAVSGTPEHAAPPLYALKITGTAKRSEARR